MAPLKLHIDIEKWPLREPFRITGYTFETIEVLVVGLEKGRFVGRGEAHGVYYRKETAASMARQIEALRPAIESGISRDSVQSLLPPCGARNALDCALWDLEARLEGRPAWSAAGLEIPHPVLTVFTCGADAPEAMALAARAYTNARAVKLKLTGEPNDADRVRAVREARPDVWLSVDANQGFDRTALERLMPVLLEARVALIEQPFPIAQDGLLEGFQSPIPIAADESVQCLRDIPGLVDRFNVVNIKLDKCGGLTEGLAMARAAQSLGLDVMVGNMIGTSLAMAPAFLVGQLCSVVDLDGPVFLKDDRYPAVVYEDGFISCSEALWGGSAE
jgi:L-alanine-DL-glutamate epimerase-like enolase superfamily enzyme